MSTNLESNISRGFVGQYLEAPLSELELGAMQWLDGFYSLEHLLCTRAWVLKLFPGASAELKFAALTHDAERHFPGGPTSTPSKGFDDPDYLFAHSVRSADIVQAWLQQQLCKPADEFIIKIRKFILRHEIGGSSEEDVLQAANRSLFLKHLIGWWLSGLERVTTRFRARWRNSIGVSSA